MNPHEIIHEILLDMSLHPLIEDGMVNFSNKVHLRILEEKLTSFGMSKKDVSEIIDNVIEGQFPDRQAYNKEGWLVTFPSPEYKQAAIKKGTHFASDPTHGKGGMNLYYKKKGKQARMTQQDPSAVEPEEPAQAGGTTGASPETGQTAPATSGNSALPSTDGKTEKPSTEPSAPTNGTEPPAGPKDGAKGETSTDSSLPASAAAEKPAGNAPAAPAVPATPTAPTPLPPPSFVGISVKFAKNKHWSPTPYGEWRNATGETAAIVALSGEVVPLKAHEREELKLLADKKQL